jgi:hypothetical protein
LVLDQGAPECRQLPMRLQSSEASHRLHHAGGGPAKRLKELERENDRRRKAVSELTLEAAQQADVGSISRA